MTLPAASPRAGAPGAAPWSRRRELVVLLGAIAAVALAARLGFWQLDRAAQKVALQTALETRAAAPLLDAASLARRPEDVPAQAQRRVLLEGTWVGERTVFLDNRPMAGRVGFFVVTPLRLRDATASVLVQRGWVPRDFADRAAVPAATAPSGPVRVEGTIAVAPSRMFELGPAASGVIRQNVDPAPFALETGLDLLPLAVIESATGSNANDGLERHWPPPATDVQKHYGYAFQWFAIGTAIAILYAWFRLVRPRQRRARA